MASTSSGSVFSRLRSDSGKLTTVVDAEGRLVEAESRSDEEQHEKLQQIIDLLLAAGYFRARIKGLSAFDKIVGGMTWCITTCNVDIDVDLLFQENATIGQKISLTEKIVAVLPRMKCPHRIEPHQIQGLDAIHVFPVMQWLVRRAIETREEMGDYIRSFAVAQFNKSFSMPQDKVFQERLSSSSATIKAVKHSYRPQRRLRRPDIMTLKGEETRVRSTLLEYGRKYGFVPPGGEKVAEGAEVKPEDQEAAEKQRKVEEKRIKKLLSGMAEASGQEGRIAASAVGNILQAQEIQEAAATYAEKQAQLEKEQEEADRRGGGVQHHQRTVAALQKQIQAMREEVEEVKGKQVYAQEEYSSANQAVAQAEEKGAEMEQELEKLAEMETGQNQAVLQELRDLVAMNEALRKQEQQFKAHCKEELARLQGETARLEKEIEESTSEDRARLEQVKKQYAADKEKLDKIRAVSARKTREMAVLQRRLDEVPSRAELAQYQRRFLELYDQVAATHRETKQFFTLYNTLDDTKLYLAKEVSLLNSIHDTFAQAMQSASGKEQFLKQLEQIVEGVRLNKTKVEAKSQQAQIKKDQLGEEHRALLDTQRAYFKMLKDFREECRNGQELEKKMASEK